MIDRLHERRRTLPEQLDDLIARIKEYARSLRARVLAVLVWVAVASSLWAVSRTHGGWEALALNFGTEMAGAVATYALLEVFLGTRERREAKKADLIAQMGSRVHDVAIAAAEELRRRGWLRDGSLQGAHLSEAILQEANLWGANLRGANLFEAKFDENTMLPDFTWWSPDTDLTRFTDPKHPDFWRRGMAAATENSHSPDDSSTGSVIYHVYENYPENKARIHFSHCRYCNCGKGVHGRGRKTENGEWHGPFNTFQEALDAANATGRNASTCKHCNPH